MRVRSLFNNFVNGEVSPLVFGRIDSPQYQTGCKQLKNMIPDRRGGAYSRSSIRYLGETKDNGLVRFIPFVVSRELSYTIELGVNYLRLWRDSSNVLVENTPMPEEVDADSDGTADFIDDDSDGTADFIDSDSDGFVDIPAASQQVGEIVELSTPYTAADIQDVQFAQANDVMYLVSDTSKPRKLVRTNNYTWELQTPSLVGAPWDDKDDGHIDGFPRTICFYQQRLVLGGTASEPQTLWMSRVADFENFISIDTTLDEDSDGNPDYLAYDFDSDGVPDFTSANDIVVDDDSMELPIAAYTQEIIQWLIPNKNLLIGTTANEHRIAVNGYLAPSNPPQIFLESNYGSRFIQPVFVGNQSIFIQASGQKLRSYALNLSANVEIYESQDLSLLANHLVDEGINRIVYQQIPDSVLWVVTDSGKLLSMTYDPSLNQTGYAGIGWAEHPIDGVVETITVIPKEKFDEVWVVVNRDGSRYVGKMVDDEYALDCSTEKESDTAFTTMDVPHLAGETVRVILDGALDDDTAVAASGLLTLPRAARFAQVGIGYTQVLETLPIETGVRDGTSVGRKSRVYEIFVKLFDSVLPKINGELPDDRSATTAMGSREPLTTGDVEAASLENGEDSTILIEQDLPFSMNILSVNGSLEVGNE